MLSKAKAIGLFEGVSLPSSSRSISHLQYTDDVIMFIKNESDSIKGVKIILQCFQGTSGLKINFQKSNIYGFGDPEEKMLEWSDILNCRVGVGPIKYLGAQIGVSPKRLAF